MSRIIQEKIETRILGNVIKQAFGELYNIS